MQWLISAGDKAHESPVQAVTSTSCLCVSHTSPPPQSPFILPYPPRGKKELAKLQCVLEISSFMTPYKENKVGFHQALNKPLNKLLKP